MSKYDEKDIKFIVLYLEKSWKIFWNFPGLQSRNNAFIHFHLWNLIFNLKIQVKPTNSWTVSKMRCLAPSTWSLCPLTVTVESLVSCFGNEIWQFPHSDWILRRSSALFIMKWRWNFGSTSNWIWVWAS